MPIAVALTLWLCAAMQQSLAQRLSFSGFTPDFLLVAAACYSMALSRSAGAFVGFFAGALYGAIDFANITHYVVSRTCAGFCIAWANDLSLEGGVFAAILTTAIGTVFARLIYMFLAPPLNLVPFLGDTIRTAMYNGVLAVPMYMLVKKIVGPAR